MPDRPEDYREQFVPADQQISPERKEENFEVISSSVDTFSADQDNPEWRNKVCEEWYTSKISRMERFRDLTDEVRGKVREITSDQGSILLPLSFYKKVNSALDTSLGPYVHNLLTMGADDKTRPAGNFLEDLKIALAKEKFGGYEIIPQPEPGRREGDFSWHVVDHPDQFFSMMRTDQSYTNLEKADFIDPNLRKEAFEQAAPFNYRLDLSALPDLYRGNWEAYKKVLQFFRDNHLNFVLTEKFGGIFTHHFERKKP